LKYRVPHDSVSFNIQISEGTKIHCNAQMTQRFIKKYCELDAAGNRMLEMVTERLGFSARTYNRIRQGRPHDCRP
jgi:predicted ATPase with chaperone activity